MLNHGMLLGEAAPWWDESLEAFVPDKRDLCSDSLAATRGTIRSLRLPLFSAFFAAVIIMMVIAIRTRSG